jgi:hypothetical protein
MATMSRCLPPVDRFELNQGNSYIRENLKEDVKILGTRLLSGLGFPWNGPHRAVFRVRPTRTKD